MPAPVRHNLWTIGWVVFIISLALVLGVLL